MLGELELANVATVGAATSTTQYSSTCSASRGPVLFAIPGHGKAIKDYSAFLAGHSGDTDNVVEAVCDMAKPSWAAWPNTFPTPS